MQKLYKTREEAIVAAENEGWVDEFDGMNCNDYLDEDQEPCDGWDGVSRRCSCGNRRVSWATAGDSTNGFYAYAEAF